MNRPVGSTYRLQLNGLGFDGAVDAVGYLADLGIETLYVSPITRARHNSGHGYDVVDPNAIDPALGGRPGYDRLLEALGRQQMRLLIDIVPNHMAASVENAMFADVLRFGRRSRFAPVFDIAWEVADNTVVLPVLDGPLAAALDAGRIRLVRSKPGGDYQLSYEDLLLPFDPAGEEDLAAELAESGDVKEPVGRRHLELLLTHQHYRLVDWRSAGGAVNYRRFFDINDLIGVRQEDREVFDLTHELVVGLAADPRVAGVRVDHVDGLRDPAGYLSMLRRALDSASADRGDRPVILVEKILSGDEELPAWPVDGTTGYEFAALVTGLFIDADGAAELARAIAAATGDGRSFAERAAPTKRAIIDELFPARLGFVSTRITRAVPLGLGPRPNPADISVSVEALSAHLGVYRTYRRPGERLSQRDRRQVERAAASARPELTDREAAALDQVIAVLKGTIDSGAIGWEAVASWQQLTPAVTAKGVEDTAMYTPGTMLAAVDVGTDPDRPAVAVECFNEHMARRAREHPHALSALSTHDSKRSQDIRSRIAVLSEIPERWESAIAALEALHGGTRPDAADRRLLYENIVGGWPIDDGAGAGFVQRVQEYIVKAAREAKRHTSWLRPDEGYELALQELAHDVITDHASRTTLEAIVAAVELPGVTNSLASIVLRGAAPGVPDVYQSDELWFQAFVDPDNRRALDLMRLRGAESASESIAAGDLLARWRDGRIKQAMVRAVLQARRHHAELFAEGDFAPLTVTGAAADHVVAFARATATERAIVVVPRLTRTLAGSDRFAVGRQVWRDTTIEIPTAASGEPVDVLTGTSYPASTTSLEVGLVLAQLPVALLVAPT